MSQSHFTALSTLLLCILFSSSKAEPEYDVPKSAQYPFGDEAFNADMAEERVHEESQSIDINVIRDIYTFCPNTTEDEEERLLDEIPYNDNECDKCDVRPTSDKMGVLVECFNCSDVSMLTTSPEDVSPTHILFLARYIEIANYTSPDQYI